MSITVGGCAKERSYNASKVYVMHKTLFYSVPCYAKVNLAKKALNGIRPTKYTIKSSLGRLIGKKGKVKT